MDSPDIQYSSSIEEPAREMLIVDNEDSKKDALAIYVAAAIAFFIPLVGYFYLICFRKRCCMDGLNTRRKRKAYVVLGLFTITNTIIWGILLLLWKYDRLKL